MVKFLTSELLVVAEFSRVPAFDQAVLATWSGMIALPYAKLAWCVHGFFVIVGVVLFGWWAVLASSGSTSISLTKSSPPESRASGCLAHCSFIGHDFLWPTISTQGRKRTENSPLHGWPIWSGLIVVLNDRGISGPFSCRWCWHWLIQGRRTIPWSSRCRWWPTYPFTKYYVTLNGVEPCVRPCWLQKSSSGCPRLLSTFVPLEYNQAWHDHGHMIHNMRLTACSQGG